MLPKTALGPNDRDLVDPEPYRRPVPNRELHRMSFGSAFEAYATENSFAQVSSAVRMGNYRTKLYIAPAIIDRGPLTLQILHALSRPL